MLNHVGRASVVPAILFFLVGVCESAGDVGADEGAAVVRELQEQAEKLRPLVKSQAGRAVLDATADLPVVAIRVVYRDKERQTAFSEEQYNALSAEDQARCERAEYDAQFYYHTRYGTPMVYARPLDLIGQAGFESFRGKKILDFGYGAIGHLRMLASLGADVVGTEVQPVYPVLYGQAGDQGKIAGRDGVEGSIRLIHGRFPAEAEVREAVGAGYDLIMSKNTLKRGYVHPEREVEERMRLTLGVDDAAFVKAVFEALKPGGLFLIYNLSPAQNPPDQPYIPWADGRCPFDRALLESTGFEVVEYDRDDCETAHQFWMTLGLNEGQDLEQLRKDLFAHYTLCRRAGG